MSEWLGMLVSLTAAGSAASVGIVLLRTVLPDAFRAKWQYVIGKAALLFFLRIQS